MVTDVAKLKPRRGRNRHDLVVMQQEDVTVRIRSELQCLVLFGVLALRKPWQWVSHITSVGSGHDDNSPGSDELGDLLQKLIRVRDVLDDLTDKHRVERPRKGHLQRVAWCVANGAAFIFGFHIIDEIAAEVVPDRKSTRL